MRDAVGGTVNIAIIIFLIALLSGYLAFSVNYTKAFRVKNEIINYIEEYEGYDCGNNIQSRIGKYIDSQHYKIPNTLMSTVSSDFEGDYYCDQKGGYCVKRTIVTPTKVDANDKNTLKGAYYTVVTFVNIEVPIIQNIFSALASQFNVRGDTRIIYSAEGSSELGGDCLNRR